MILTGIETITRQENIGSCRVPQIVSQKFFAIVDCEEGITVKLPIPSHLVDALKEWSFEAARIRVAMLNSYNNEHSQEVKNQE